MSTGTTEGAATTGGGAAAARQLGLLSVEAARDAVLAAAEPVGTERVPVGDTLGRVIAEAAIAGVSLPPWPNSAMDGYAIVAADTAAASDEEPVRLEIIGDIRAGAEPDVVVRHGTGARIATGAPLPAGADAVVPVEGTTPLDATGAARTAWTRRDGTGPGRVPRSRGSPSPAAPSGQPAATSARERSSFDRGLV